MAGGIQISPPACRMTTKSTVAGESVDWRGLIGAADHLTSAD